MRLRTTSLLVLVVAFVAAAGAWTDAPRVQLTETPRFVVRGAIPWHAVVRVTRRGRPLDGVRAVMTVRGPDGTRRVPAQALGAGRYRVRVRTPEAGFYHYTIAVGDGVAAHGEVFSAG